MKIYYVLMNSGHVTLVKANDDPEIASDIIYMAEGYNNVRGIREATQEDIAWVRAMGGWVPEDISHEDVA